MALLHPHSSFRLALLAGSGRVAAAKGAWACSRGRSTLSGPKPVSQSSAAAPRDQRPALQDGQWRIVYEGGLARVARVMKLASVASLVGATAAVPFFFAGDSDVPSMARMILAMTTIGMTGSSTALVAWALRPYITSLSVLETGDKAIGPDTPLLVDTMTILAQCRTRLVFPQMLGPSTQPLTSWRVQRPDSELAASAGAVLAQINAHRKKKVSLAQPGDVFYAHIQGTVGPDMQSIIAASSCPT